MKSATVASRRFGFAQISVIARFCVIIVIFLFLLTSNNCSSEPGTRVLFIGNSLTFTNDLPGMIARLAQTRNRYMEYEMFAPGGYTFSQHASNPELKKMIDKGTWDLVVLQEQSQMPALEDQKVAAEVFPNAQKLSQLIRQSNSKASVVFFMTMAKKNGDPDNSSYIPELGTYDGMQKRLITSYTRMAQQNRGILAPVGLAWKKVRSEKPALNLYQDETHPDITGTYLAACVFYAVLFKDSPVGLSHPGQIDDNTAEYLQKTADQTRIERYDQAFQRP
ncbi:MAG: DUF4886 domain-containing protein [Candidatus Riflebacteria bacterium]|nr:DUF4886 domain-containing protein [Candidatus Riflebacteria bacterium]